MTLSPLGLEQNLSPLGINPAASDFIPPNPTLCIAAVAIHDAMDILATRDALETLAVRDAMDNLELTEGLPELSIIPGCEA